MQPGAHGSLQPCEKPPLPAARTKPDDKTSPEGFQASLPAGCSEVTTSWGGNGIVCENVIFSASRIAAYKQLQLSASMDCRAFSDSPSLETCSPSLPHTSGEHSFETQGEEPKSQLKPAKSHNILYYVSGAIY